MEGEPDGSPFFFQALGFKRLFLERSDSPSVESWGGALDKERTFRKFPLTSVLASDFYIFDLAKKIAFAVSKVAITIGVSPYLALFIINV